MKVPVIELPLILHKDWDGFALFFCIVVRDKTNEKVIKHELEHVRQWWRYGVVGFPFVYGWWLLHYGYEQHPLEIEARLAEYK